MRRAKRDAGSAVCAGERKSSRSIGSFGFGEKKRHDVRLRR
jgi:hypothetical protein